MLRNIPSFFIVVLLIAAVWFSFYSSRPREIKSETAPETEFSTAKAFKHVEAIAQEPHFVGSADHSRVRNYIVNALQQMGLEVQTQEGFSLSNSGVLARPQNILSRIEGSGKGNALVLMTHYDSAPHSSYGASDAASGVATILEGMRAFLANNPEHKNDMIILFTDAEELGLNGAGLFVENHPWARDAKLALNFESRGSGGNSFMLLETDKGNVELIKAFKKANPEHPVTNSLAYSVYKMLPNDTDLTVLREQGSINGFNFAFIDDHFDYHTATDLPENLDKQSLAHQGSYLMPLLRHFKDADLENLNAEEDLLYFNLPGGEIVSYPFFWIFPMLILAIILFFLLIAFGISRKRLSLKTVFQGFLPLFLSLIISGLSVYLLWKFCLYFYPEYSEMEHGFTYNGYSYIASSLFLALAVSFYTYYFNRKREAASLFVAPLFLWLLLCTLLAIYLKGAAYFIIPVGFGLLQLYVMIQQKKPNLLLMAFLALPAIFLLMPFISTFPVALGLDILFASAVLCVLLFVLLLPVFGPLKLKKIPALLCFLLFGIFFISAHFKSDFSEKRPKPNSLVYMFDADKNLALWRSYDKLPDDWTRPYFGENPQIYPAEKSTFSSKYGSGFTYKAEAPLIAIEEPGIVFQKKNTGDSQFDHYTLKIAPRPASNRIELFADRKMNFKKFSVNGLEAEENHPGVNALHVFKNRSEERLLTYYISTRDSLRLEFSLKKDQVPEFTLYESSYDLIQNNQLNVPERPKTMIPRPFVLNDAIILKKQIKPE